MTPPTDRPISSKDEDKLGRARVASVLAEEIRSIDASKGLVMGILGPWGSGKTSLVHLIQEELREIPPLTLIEFNPWLFSGANQLVENFFVEVGAQFRRRGDRLAEVAKDLDAYAEVVSPLRWLPVVGPWIDRFGAAAKAVRKANERRRGGVAAQRSALTKKLSALDMPVVILIDDIDRLQTDEIREIFKLVRLTANFPNIIYLLAFDRVRVEQALSEEGINGRDYLEKILQVAHDIPVIPETVLVNTLIEALDESLADFQSPGPFASEDWSDILFEVVHPLIRNMRDVRRYVLAVHGTVRGLEGRVELVDVLALEAVRVFLPDVFHTLPEAREGLTTPSSLGTYQQHETSTLKTSVENLVAAADEHADVVRSLIERCFPAGRRHIGNMHFGPEFQATWLKERRVAHVALLDFYLERQIGDKLAAFSIAEQTLRQLGDGEGLTLLDDLDPEQLTDTIAQLEAFEGDFPHDGIAAGSAALLNQIHRMPKRQGGMFGVRSEIVVDRVVLRMLRQFESTAEVEKVVRETLPMVHQLSDRFTLLKLVGFQENAGHKLISESAAHELEAELARQVRNARPEELAKERDLLRLFYWVPKFDQGSSVEMPEDPAVMSALLKSCLTETWSQSSGSRATTRSGRLHWDTLVQVAGGEPEVKKMVERTNELASRDPELQEARQLAERYLSGWRPKDFGDDDE